MTILVTSVDTALLMLFLLYQVAPKGVFAAQSDMPAVRVHVLGETTKTVDELKSFLRTISHKFTAQTYDLLRYQNLPHPSLILYA